MGSKISQKISFSPVFLPANVLSSLSLPAASSALEDPHRNIPSPPTDDVSTSPRTQILTGDRHSHRKVFPLLSADSLLLHLFLSSPTTSSQHCHHFFHHSYPDHQLHRRKPTQPPSCHRGSLSSPSSPYLSSATFSYPSRNRLRPPSPQPKPPKPPAEPPHHVRDPHARQLPPLCFATFFFLARRGCCMQNSFLHAAAN